FRVQNRLSLRFLLITSATLFLLAATMISLVAAQQQGQANAPAAGQAGGEGRGRGRGAPNPLLSQPAPRLPDGTINLGRVPGEKGIWNLPYIQNMGSAQYFVGAPQTARGGGGRGRGGDAAAGGQIGGGEGAGGRGGRRRGGPSGTGGALQPLAAGVHHYNSLHNSKNGTEGCLFPPPGP